MPKINRSAPVSLALVAPLFCLLTSALPASAQIQGYGKDATGGAGGSVCTVTSSASSGTGSFSSCLSAGNRTIQFAVASATVNSTLYVRANTTIDGCANGQNGVTMDLSGGTNGSVIIEGPVSNIIVRCLRFQGPGGTSEGSDLLGFDGTGGQISRVAIERSTFVGAADGALDITGDVSDVTVQNSLFYGTILTQLIKYDTRMRISLHHNVYTAGGERNPQIKGDATAFDFVSNVVHANTLSADAYGTRLWNGNSSSDSPGNVQINMVANAFMGTNGNIIIQSDSGASASGIYIASNNYCSPASNCPSSPASSPQFTAPAAYAVTPTLPGCMATAMLPGVGSPTRTATDTQKINAVASALPTNCTGGTPTVSIGDASVTEGNSGTTTATFTATLSASASSTITVGYATANGTATAGSDYVTQSGTLTFTAGQTSKTIAIVVNGDTAVEPNETFTVNLSTPSGATILDGLGAGTIVTDDSLPSLSINDVSVSEGNSGTKAATFTVNLSAASTSSVSVTYATANGTATTPSDYAAVGGSVTFPAGITSQTLTVTLNGDTTVEPNETLMVNLSGATGATILDTQGVGTITNDDSAALPTLSINDVSVTEGNSGTQTATFTATLSASASTTVTVGYSTANGTATAGSDYVAGSGTLTFTTGQTTKTLAVVVNGDTTVEANETFTVNLATPAGATILDAQGVGTIINNDSAALPTLSIGDWSVTEGNSGTASATFTATLSAAASTTVTVGYSTANGTATAGSDYVAGSGALTFTAGQTTKTVAVVVNGDTTVEANETFTVNLATPSGATILDGQGVGTIVNDDSAALPTLSIGDWSVTEGNTGTTSATFTATLSAAASSTVTVGYSTANGTATAGSDYVAGSGTLTFAAGQTTKTVVVVVNGDTTVEPNETFTVNLASPSGATILDGQGVGTMVNDDSTPPSGAQPVVWASMVGVSASGGSLTKTAVAGWNAGAVSSQTLTAGDGYVEFTGSETSTYRMLGLSNGDSGQSYNDTDFAIYLAGAQVHVYEKGLDRGTFSTFVTGDKLRVSVESGIVKYRKNGTLFYTSGSTPTYPLLVDSSLHTAAATLTSAVISVGSAPPQIQISDVSVPEGNAGTTAATLTVTLSPAASSAVTVSYATANATATAGSDYVASNGVVTFAAGSTSQTITVTVTGDTTVEANETFSVNLTSPVGATIADAQGVATVVNDDGAAPSEEAVVWTSMVGVSASGGSLTKTAAAGWNAGAVSNKALTTGDGYVEFTGSETSTYRMLGLSNGDSGQSYNDTDFAIYLAGAQVQVYEKGLTRGTFSTFVPGDKLRVSVESGVVKYRKNGTLLYTSAVTPTYPLLVDTSLHTPAATLTNTVISGTLQ